MALKFYVSRIVEDKSGVHFVHYTRFEDFPNSEGRHCNLCVVCGFPTYPECRNWCMHCGYESESNK